jgi:uncharacterized Zn finger protein
VERRVKPPPWSARFIARLESFGMRQPSAGRDGDPNQVYDLTITAGTVTARVQGSRRRPYDVWIDLPVIGSGDWTRATRTMSAEATCAAQLLDGEVPDDLDDLFGRIGLPLLPARARDLTMDCSCPEWDVYCRHLAAVLGRLAKAFDADPFEILAWRGCDRVRLLEQLEDLRAPVAGPAPAEVPVSADGEDSLTNRLEDYWSTDEDWWDELRRTDRREHPDLAADRLGRPDIVILGRNLADLLRPAYQAFNSW